MDLIFFTICANNYIALAKCCLDSVRRHHPGAKTFVFIADRSEQMPDAACHQIVHCSNLALPRLRQMAFAYDVTEFNTALKPSCFRWLFERYPGAKYVYLDPDIWVLSRIEPLERALAAGAELVLTPHITKARNEETPPDDRTILLGGTYNLGFVALADGASTRDLVQWWERHLERDCRSSPAEGLFVDQRWMDLAPGFVESTAILRQPGCNLAYWNLHERRISREGEQWYANGEVLYFFHFSGIDLEGSRFTKYHDHFTPAALGPEVVRLQGEYAERVFALGHRTSSGMPYGFAEFDNGETIHQGHRIYYRNRLWNEIDSPFGLDRSFFDAPEPSLHAAGAPYISRVLHGIWLKWPELQWRFDLHSKAGRNGYLAWLHEWGLAQEKLAGLPIPEPDPPLDDQLARLSSLQEEQRARLSSLERELEDEKALNKALLSSTSWRMTAWLRALTSRIRRRPV